MCWVSTVEQARIVEFLRSISRMKGLRLLLVLTNVFRRDHTWVAIFDVGAPDQPQVVLLATLQADALHADPMAILGVKIRRWKNRTSAVILLLIGDWFHSTTRANLKSNGAHTHTLILGADFKRTPFWTMICMCCNPAGARPEHTISLAMAPVNSRCQVAPDRQLVSLKITNKGKVGITTLHHVEEGIPS